MTSLVTSLLPVGLGMAPSICTCLGGKAFVLLQHANAAGSWCPSSLSPAVKFAVLLSRLDRVHVTAQLQLMTVCVLCTITASQLRANQVREATYDSDRYVMISVGTAILTSAEKLQHTTYSLTCSFKLFLKDYRLLSMLQHRNTYLGKPALDENYRNFVIILKRKCSVIHS